MTHLEIELTARGIPFDRVANRIRYLLPEGLDNSCLQFM